MQPINEPITLWPLDQEKPPQGAEFPWQIDSAAAMAEVLVAIIAAKQRPLTGYYWIDIPAHLIKTRIKIKDITQLQKNLENITKLQNLIKDFSVNPDHLLNKIPMNEIDTELLLLHNFLKAPPDWQEIIIKAENDNSCQENEINTSHEWKMPRTKLDNKEKETQSNIDTVVYEYEAKIKEHKKNLAESIQYSELSQEIDINLLINLMVREQWSKAHALVKRYHRLIVKQDESEEKEEALIVLGKLISMCGAFDEKDARKIHLQMVVDSTISPITPWNVFIYNDFFHLKEGYPKFVNLCNPVPILKTIQQLIDHSDVLPLPLFVACILSKDQTAIQLFNRFKSHFIDWPEHKITPADLFTMVNEAESTLVSLVREISENHGDFFDLITEKKIKEIKSEHQYRKRNKIKEGEWDAIKTEEYIINLFDIIEKEIKKHDGYNLTIKARHEIIDCSKNRIIKEVKDGHIRHILDLVFDGNDLSKWFELSRYYFFKQDFPRAKICAYACIDAERENSLYYAMLGDALSGFNAKLANLCFLIRLLIEPSSGSDWEKLGHLNFQEAFSFFRPATLNQFNKYLVRSLIANSASSHIFRMHRKGFNDFAVGYVCELFLGTQENRINSYLYDIFYQYYIEFLQYILGVFTAQENCLFLLEPERFKMPPTLELNLFNGKAEEDDHLSSVRFFKKHMQIPVMPIFLKLKQASFMLVGK